MNSKIKLVIFDFDGTLVDTAPDLVRSTNLFLKSEGLAPLTEERIRSEIGMGLRNLILDVFPKAEDQTLSEDEIYQGFIKIYEQEFLKSPTLFEGALEFLSNWEGQIAIVSNKRERFIHPIVKQLQLDRLDWAHIVGGDTCGHMKPHPEPFLAAIEAAGVAPEQTLIVGDGAPDVEGAMAIECHCVAVDFGYTPVETLMTLGAWRKIESYFELKPLIESIT